MYDATALWRRFRRSLALALSSRVRLLLREKNLRHGAWVCGWVGPRCWCYLRPVHTVRCAALAARSAAATSAWRRRSACASAASSRRRLALASAASTCVDDWVVSVRHSMGWGQGTVTNHRRLRQRPCRVLQGASAPQRRGSQPSPGTGPARTRPNISATCGLAPAPAKLRATMAAQSSIAPRRRSSRRRMLAATAIAPVM